MTTPQIKIVNAETGEEIERPMNAEELAQWEKDKADYEAMKEIERAEAEQKATEKAALLAQLGITEQQAKLLLS